MHFPSSRRARSAHTLAKGLGCVSIGLGVAAFLAPRGVGRATGVRHPHLWRGAGLREIATGIGLLTAKDPRPWMWGRVAGDAADFATLVPGLLGRRPLSALVALAAVATIGFVDYYCASELDEIGRPKRAARDYRARSGFPKPANEMRGAARSTEV